MYNTQWSFCLHMLGFWTAFDVFFFFLRHPRQLLFLPYTLIWKACWRRQGLKFSLQKTRNPIIASTKVYGRSNFLVNRPNVLDRNLIPLPWGNIPFCRHRRFSPKTIILYPPIRGHANYWHNNNNNSIRYARMTRGPVVDMWQHVVYSVRILLIARVFRA